MSQFAKSMHNVEPQQQQLHRTSSAKFNNHNHHHHHHRRRDIGIDTVSVLTERVCLRESERPQSLNTTNSGNSHCASYDSENVHPYVRSHCAADQRCDAFGRVDAFHSAHTPTCDAPRRYNDDVTMRQPRYTAKFHSANQLGRFGGVSTTWRSSRQLAYLSSGIRDDSMGNFSHGIMNEFVSNGVPNHSPN